MKAENLRDLFERGLEAAYDCEQQLMKALPHLLASATIVEVGSALQEQLIQAGHHETRLEQVFAGLERAASADTNHVVKTILEDSEKLSKHIDRSALLDAALIANQNLVGHYKIAVYGSVTAFAQTLGLPEIAGILAECLADEKENDKVLTALAEASVNGEAAKIHNSPHGFAMI